MTNFLNLSKRSYIALHSLLYLAQEKQLTNVKDLAKRLHISYFHLSKILQQFVKKGWLKSIKGPAGGFQLIADPGQIKLRQILEEIEGNIGTSCQKCIFNHDNCPFSQCMFGQKINHWINEIIIYISSHSLKDIMMNMDVKHE